uniref:Uncharacterized protein n=1 Tax=Davidia involucrata TaxID=16924 RepID=A0A5B6Z0S0_DAVIN
MATIVLIKVGNIYNVAKVLELHRLYQIQKILMKSMESSSQIDDRHGAIKQKPRQTLDLEQPADEYYIEESDGDGVLEIEDEREIELTLGPTSYCRRKKGETPLTSDSGLSFSSSSSGSSHLKRTILGTQQRIDKTRDEFTGHKWGLVEMPDVNPALQSGRKNSFDVEEQSRQDRLKQPPWLFQALSLNMT